MDAKDKYLMGMLWKFGTIKPGTNQFVFQSYDKYEQMEYIRKRLAPSKVIKVSTRKDPRTGAEKTLYRLNFTNEEWAENVRMYEGMKAEKIADKNFVRGFFEVKGNINKNGKTRKSLVVSGDASELTMIQKVMISTTNISGSVSSRSDNSSGHISYSKADMMKLVSEFGADNPKFWGEMLKKMNPDD